MKNLTKSRFIILLGAILLLTPVIVTNSQAQTGGNFEIIRSTLDGGGESSSGGDFIIQGTIGQMDSTNPNALTGGIYSLSGGFWTADIGGNLKINYLPVILKSS